MSIDEDLQSRQMAVYGRESMMKLSKAKVLVSGMNGLGAETAKNVILANVQHVTLHDTKNVAMSDLGSNFYLSKQAVGKNRAEACRASFQELNPSVEVKISTAPLTPELVKNFNVVVLTDCDLKTATKIDDACRAAGIKFLYGTVHGVFTAVFADYGKGFVCNDVDGESVKTAIVHSIEKSKPGEKALVQCVHDEDLDLNDDDMVVFTEVKGMTQLNDGKPRKVYDVSKMKKHFKIEDTSSYDPYVTGGIITEKKIPKTLDFRSMQECLTDPGQLTDNDTSKQSKKALAFDEEVLVHMGQPSFEQKYGRSGLLLLALRALDEVGVEAARMPGGGEKVVEAAKKLNGELSDAVRVEELEDRVEVLKAFAHCAGASLNPMCAITGGILGQEVVKACTAKFHPTFQWFLFDCEECLPPPSPCDRPGSRYDDQIQVFGKEMQQKLSNLNIFLVGSGALGCEFLKNFSLMGCCTQPSKTLTVTDDDTIEKSNLSRQFLFRNHNIGQSKSEAASVAAKKMNEDFNVVSKQERVQPSTENIFDDYFWDSLDVVVNALDNIKARLYVDSRCVFYGKPLFESGTLGPKCNAQVVIPHVTENYGATRDPPEKEAPQCALHNFPHNIDHCLGLARSEFVGNFETVPSDANEFAKNPDSFISGLLEAGENAGTVLDKLIGDPKFNCAMSGGIEDVLVAYPASKFEDCVSWARAKYESYFVDRINLLVHNCPKEMKTESGNPFWSPPKRFPHAVPFDPKDPVAMKFIIAASNLRAQMYGIKEEHRDEEYFQKVLQGVKVPTFVPFKAKVDTGAENEEGGDANAAESAEEEQKKAINDASAKLKGKPLGKELFVNEFEKDNDMNFHIDFIQSFANLRARNYDIGEVDFLQAKLKAGRIIPAIATATAMATGFVCLEMYKYIGKLPSTSYRNTFSNLALPLYSRAEPVPCDKVTSGTRFDPEMYMDVDEVAVPDPQTIWDTMRIPGNKDTTVADVAKFFKENHNLDFVGWIVTSTDGKADSSPLEGKMSMKVMDVMSKAGFDYSKAKYIELGDSPANKRLLELKTADGDDVKICRVVLQLC